MQRQKDIEWTAFSAGILLALIFWWILHPRQTTETAAIAGVKAKVAIIDESTDSYGSDKPDNQRTTDRNAVKKMTTSKNEAARHSGRTIVSNDTANVIGANDDKRPQINVRVYLTDRQRIESVSLETYVRGVVAAEMPAAFEPAALEAQALAARTYMVRRLLLRDNSNVPVPGADVTDTQTHQVYRSLADMNRLRTDNPEAWRKADDAARNTQNKIIAYQNEPIQALYFSASNGHTENSEDVFPAPLPYLRSVASPWERQHKISSTHDTIAMPLPDFYAKLGITTITTGARFGADPKIKVTERTASGRVKSLTVGAKIFTGQQFRDLLGLRSTSFSWIVKANRITITTHGNGHGVGMSQWGAEGMAQAGSTAQQIVKHYYSGTEIMEVSKLLL